MAWRSIRWGVRSGSLVQAVCVCIDLSPGISEAQPETEPVPVPVHANAKAKAKATECKASQMAGAAMFESKLH